MLGCLDDDVAHRVEPGPARATGDLVELTGTEVTLPLAVELDEGGEHHGADRHVDADAERVGAADDAQVPGLDEPLDQTPVAREHAGVVDADTQAQEPRERAAEAAGEPLTRECVGDGLALLLGGDGDGGERLRAFQGRSLGEVDEVDRGTVRGEASSVTSSVSGSRE